MKRTVGEEWRRRREEEGNRKAGGKNTVKNDSRIEKGKSNRRGEVRMEGQYVRSGE